MKQYLFTLLTILVFSNCTQNQVVDPLHNDVLKDDYKGPVKSVKIRENIIVFNDNTGKNDTILKDNGLSIMNEDLFFNKAGYLTTKIDYFYKEKTINKYDSNNRLIETIISNLKDKMQEKVSYIYDKHGRKIEEIYSTPDNKIRLKFINEYSNDGLLLKTDRVIDVNNEVDTYIYRYDKQGRLVYEEHKSNRWANTIKKIEYNRQGNYKTITHISNGNLEYIRKYNSDEIEIHLVWYNKNGKKRFEHWCDDYGNIIKHIDYNEDGTTPNKIETKTYIYDGNGKVLKSLIKNQLGEVIGNEEYLYDKKGRLIYSSENSGFYGSNSISEYKYNKYGSVIYMGFVDYAERGSYREIKYDKHQNQIIVYEDDGGADGESGHDNYNLYTYEIEYYPYEETHIVNVEKSFIFDKKMQNTGMYVIRGDKIHLFYKGKDFSVFEYKTKDGAFISGLINNNDIQIIAN